MELVRLGDFIHGVARVWASHPYQIVVLWRQICRDMAFSFAAILSSNQHVNKSFDASPVEAEPGRCPDQNVGSRILFGIYNNVGDFSQFLDATFSGAGAHLIVGRKLFNVRGSVSIALREYVGRSR